MPTNDRKVNIYHKRLLSRTAIKEQFLDYLQGCVDDIADGIYAGSSGTLDQDAVGLLETPGYPGTFMISTMNANRVLAGGHIVNLDGVQGPGITTRIPFENSTGITYYIGVFFAEVEVGIEINGRTGDPEYPALKQAFGNVDNPSSVVDHTTYIRVYLDTITEVGASHVGRAVRVWMSDPVSPDESIAFYDGVVAYDGSHNYVDIAYSGALGPLGQDTSDEPPSTTATDYKVFIEGISWRRTVDLSAVDGCAFLGTALGDTPPTFDTSGQQLLQIISLDRAYDGIPGPGTGRAIAVDAGAVEMNTTSSTGDKQYAQLRLNRIASTSNFQVSLEVLMGAGVKSVPIACVQRLESVGQQACSINGDTITLTGSPPDLTTLFLDPSLQLVWLETGSASKLYRFTTVTASTITCVDLLTGASPGWSSGVGLVMSFLHPRMVFGGAAPAAGLAGGWSGLSLTAADGAGNASPMLTLSASNNPGSSVPLAVVRNNRILSATPFLQKPQNILELQLDTPMTGSPGGQLIIGKYIGTVDGEDEIYAPLGLRVQPQVGGAGTADRYGFNVHPQPVVTGRLPSTRQFGLHADGGPSNAFPAEVMRWEPRGRFADVHRFVERFDYHPTGFLPASERWYKQVLGGGCNLFFNDPAYGGSGMKGHGDIVHFTTAGAASGDGCVIQGPPMFILRQLAGTMRNIHLYARARLIDSDGDRRIWVGIGVCNDYTQDRAELRIYNDGDTAASWYGHTVVGYSAEQSAVGEAADVTGSVANDLGWCDFYMSIYPSINAIWFWHTGMSTPQSMSIKSGGLSGTDWQDMRFRPFLAITQYNTVDEKNFEVDHIEVWDELIQAGPKE